MKKRMIFRWFVVMTFMDLVVLGNVNASGSTEYFKKQAISDARFGVGDREKYLKQAYEFADAVKVDVKGQDTAALILQNRLVQYFENLGTRTREPIYMNLIGLPGVGKTAMLSKLQQLDFPVAHYDAQNFEIDSNAFVLSVYQKIERANRSKAPLILVIEEVDKVPEISGNMEKTSGVIGAINQILSDGILSYNGSTVEAHNVMVLTTMNFSPTEMERFTEEVLDKRKSFYDFTIDDMQKFNDWIKSTASAKYKILSNLFRSNTVRRMAPFTVIMQPLLEDTYREIISRVVSEAIERNTDGKNISKRVEIEVDQTVIDFLYMKTVYAPSGAGETVLRADGIIDQLISFAIKAKGGSGRDFVDRPRSAKISIDVSTGKANIMVTSYVFRHSKLEPLESFKVQADFDGSSGLFLPPKELAVEKPTYIQATLHAQTAKAITQRETMQFRYPQRKKATIGLRSSLEVHLLGQGAAIDLIESEMNKYMALSKPTSKEPMFKVLSGFPGIGKSEIVKLTASHLKLPVVKVNIQGFVSDNPKSVEDFVATINNEIKRQQRAINEAEGKFIFLLEEVDKAYEITPKGDLVGRPVMAIVKDLLNDGKVEISGQSAIGTPSRQSLDISHAFTFVTMNFSVDRFGFTADPRMTTVEDVIGAWKKLNSSVAGIKQLLGSQV
ncbi:MAG: AAA family ATPase [Bdellovibrionaceae bacterium]|nr:AAA family ATPase [Pseudobdellovibrionaceae bacterium]